MPAHGTNIAAGRFPRAWAARSALWLLMGCTARLDAQATVTRADSNAALHAHANAARAATTITAGGMAIGVLTRAAPAYDGRSYTELQVTQPIFSIGIDRGALSFIGMANLEGYTLTRGELNAGIYGEGYVDRRHPHTLVHEAMVTWMPRAPRENATGTSLAVSLSAGRGFVPFGSDDPMMRPLEKYPVNHHHAQILERLQAIVAARVSRGAGSAAVEVTAFNGDEPAGPFHAPRWGRFADSWSVRGTITPHRAVELSMSEANVISPELQQGGAFDHRQRHLSLRVDNAPASANTHANANASSRYLLVEWARTDERADGIRAFRYHSFLAEGALGWRGVIAAARVERTDRAEQGRLADPFRTPVGHVEFQILGVTQWTVATVAIQAPRVVRPPSFARITPFLELSRAQPVPRSRPTVFEPAAFYGADRLWSVSAGIRVHAGSMRHRMGRYGVMGDRNHSGNHSGT